MGRPRRRRRTPPQGDRTNEDRSRDQATRDAPATRGRAAGYPRRPHRRQAARRVADEGAPEPQPRTGHVTMHRANIKVITADKLGNERVKTLTPDIVEAMLERRANLGRRVALLPATGPRYVLALGWAERRGVIARNVAKSSRSGRRPQGRDRQTMTVKQARASRRGQGVAACRDAVTGHAPRPAAGRSRRSLLGGRR